MANYSILVGETRELVDGSGTPLSSSDSGVVSFPDAFVAIGATAAGVLTVRGLAPTDGAPMTVAHGGAQVEHAITVLLPPFDWSVGAPV